MRHDYISEFVRRFGRGTSEYISEFGTDLCVGCRADTGIPTDTPIDDRTKYVEGSGQCCAACERKMRHGL